MCGLTGDGDEDSNRHVGTGGVVLFWFRLYRGEIEEKGGKEKGIAYFIGNAFWRFRYG